MGLTPETIQVTVPGPDGAPDAQGNPTPGAPVTTDLLIKGFAPRQSDESNTDIGASSISGAVVYGYRGTVIPSNAVLTIRGEDWQMEGEVGDWLSPYGPDPQGVEFAVRRAT